MRQQHLGDGYIELPEEPLIQAHQAYLADCRCRLLQGMSRGRCLQTELSHAGGDRAGRNQDKIAPALPSAGNGRGDIGKNFSVQLPPGSGQNITPEFRTVRRTCCIMPFLICSVDKNSSRIEN
ncbi:MAG: hypothetical protein MZU91_06685 [Desulfosudis oleivorans]|nr:hypothetical protein [Desulfosudis oleivorans]